MSFTGDLEHLPIVDVIQLLHATRKSGVLRIKSRKGESDLVFKDGYIVSANHLNNSVRIGQVLVDLRIITPEVLDQALLAQNQAGHRRKPLLVTLIENGQAKEADLYKGLEQLIEMTLVEILTWKRGSFTLDMGPPAVADEYRYYPEKMDLEINVNTQNVLMDALRVYDEKVRDGLLVETDFPEDVEGSEEQECPLLSAEDLGLADFDQLEAKTPQAFTSLEESDQFSMHRVKIVESAPYLSATEQEELLNCFAKCAAGREKSVVRQGLLQPLIFFSADPFLTYAVTAACSHAGVLVFATDDEEGLQQIMSRSLKRSELPLLIFDAPEKCGAGHSAETISALRQQQRVRCPQVTILQLSPPGNAAFALEAYTDGIRAVLPRPFREGGKKTFVSDTICLLTALEAYARRFLTEQNMSPLFQLKKQALRLKDVTEASEAARVLLEAASGMFERSLTLIVREKELIAERGIGIEGGKTDGVSRSLGFRVPLLKPSLFSSLVEGGSLHYGPTEDESISRHLFPAIGAPYTPSLLLLPMRCHGKTISLTYGDFGAKEPLPVPIDLLEILARQAELVLENALHRKKLVKAGL